MTKKSFVSLLALVGFAFVSPAMADNHADLKRFVGNWKCQAKTVGAQSYTYDAEFNVTELLGGQAFMEDYKEAANEKHAAPYATNGIWTYDKTAKQFVGYNVDNSGGINTRTSTGFKADKFTWNVGDGLKFNFTQKKGKPLAIAVEVKGKDGAWSNVNNLTCKL